MAPRITSLSLVEIEEGGGQRVVVIGNGFREVRAVWFGHQPSPSVKIDGSSVLTAVVPRLDPGTYYVLVQCGDLTYSDVHEQCLLRVRPHRDAAAGFRVDEVTPGWIVLGQESEQLVTGEGLLGVSAVVLGSTACEFEALEDGLLAIVVPSEPRDVQAGVQAILWIYPRSGNARALPLTVHAHPGEPRLQPHTTGEPVVAV